MDRAVVVAMNEKPGGSLAAVRRESAGCRRCPLWKNATQTVFGAGSSHGPIMLVGEQPGDAEDRAGEPFVGPAGHVLRRALSEAGIDLGDVYLTNAVKHFKWKRRGKRRLHERPNHEEIMACRIWLDMEIERVRPTVIVALGATAAGALLGPGFRIGRDRRKKLPSPLAPFVALTAHPSSILRTPETAARAQAFQQLVGDLRHIAGWLKRGSGNAQR